MVSKENFKFDIDVPWNQVEFDEPSLRKKETTITTVNIGIQTINDDNENENDAGNNGNNGNQQEKGNYDLWDNNNERELLDHADEENDKTIAPAISNGNERSSKGNNNRPYTVKSFVKTFSPSYTQRGSSRGHNFTLYADIINEESRHISIPLYFLVNN